MIAHVRTGRYMNIYRVAPLYSLVSACITSKDTFDKALLLT